VRRSTRRLPRRFAPEATLMRSALFGRYVSMRFVNGVVAVFAGIFVLVVLLDYVEMARRASNVGNVPMWTVALTSFYRVPQITEKLLPFSVLVGAMLAYLNLSRRNELVIARAAGMSAWQFVTPSLIAALVFGVAAIAIYNPLAVLMGEQSKKLEERIFGSGSVADDLPGRFWVRQRSGDGQSILNAASSQKQGEYLKGISVFIFDGDGTFTERIEADSAQLEPGRWVLSGARIYSPKMPPRELATHFLPTNLSMVQARESLATPETVAFWQLPAYIDLAEQAGLVAAGYRFQYQSLLAKPFLLASMVLLACAVSLRFFRFGGVQRMVLSGVGAGFVVYVLSKVTEDLSKAALMHPVLAAWMPVSVGAVVGTLALLFQEDG
jgi:lipopolysaccharide export system permease protein